MYVRPEAFTELTKLDESEFSESSSFFDDVEKSLGRSLTDQERELMILDANEDVDSVERI